jgi:hypothetical protein
MQCPVVHHQIELRRKTKPQVHERQHNQWALSANMNGAEGVCFSAGMGVVDVQFDDPPNETPTVSEHQSVESLKSLLTFASVAFP